MKRTSDHPGGSRSTNASPRTPSRDRSNVTSFADTGVPELSITGSRMSSSGASQPVSAGRQPRPASGCLSEKSPFTCGKWRHSLAAASPVAAATLRPTAAPAAVPAAAVRLPADWDVRPAQRTAAAAAAASPPPAADGPFGQLGTLEEPPAVLSPLVPLLGGSPQSTQVGWVLQGGPLTHAPTRPRATASRPAIPAYANLTELFLCIAEERSAAAASAAVAAAAHSTRPLSSPDLDAAPSASRSQLASIFMPPPPHHPSLSNNQLLFLTEVGPFGEKDAMGAGASPGHSPLSTSEYTRPRTRNGGPEGGRRLFGPAAGAAPSPAPGAEEEDLAELWAVLRRQRTPARVAADRPLAANAPSLLSVALPPLVESVSGSGSTTATAHVHLERPQEMPCGWDFNDLFLRLLSREIDSVQDRLSGLDIMRFMRGTPEAGRFSVLFYWFTVVRMRRGWVERVLVGRFDKLLATYQELFAHGGKQEALPPSEEVEALVVELMHCHIAFQRFKDGEGVKVDTGAGGGGGGARGDSPRPASVFSAVSMTMSASAATAASAGELSLPVPRRHNHNRNLQTSSSNSVSTATSSTVANGISVKMLVFGWRPTGSAVHTPLHSDCDYPMMRAHLRPVVGSGGTGSLPGPAEVAALAQACDLLGAARAEHELLVRYEESLYGDMAAVFGDVFLQLGQRAAPGASSSSNNSQQQMGDDRGPPSGGGSHEPAAAASSAAFSSLSGAKDVVLDSFAIIVVHLTYFSMRFCFPNDTAAGFFGTAFRADLLRLLQFWFSGIVLTHVPVRGWPAPTVRDVAEQKQRRVSRCDAGGDDPEDNFCGGESEGSPLRVASGRAFDQVFGVPDFAGSPDRRFRRGGDQFHFSPSRRRLSHTSTAAGSNTISAHVAGPPDEDTFALVDSIDVTVANCEFLLIEQFNKYTAHAEVLVDRLNRHTNRQHRKQLQALNRSAAAAAVVLPRAGAEPRKASVLAPGDFVPRGANGEYNNMKRSGGCLGGPESLRRRQMLVASLPPEQTARRPTTVHRADDSDANRSHGAFLSGGGGGGAQTDARPADTPAPTPPAQLQRNAFFGAAFIPSGSFSLAAVVDHPLGTPDTETASTSRRSSVSSAAPAAQRSGPRSCWSLQSSHSQPPVDMGDGAAEETTGGRPQLPESVTVVPAMASRTPAAAAGEARGVNAKPLAASLHALRRQAQSQREKLAADLQPPKSGAAATAPPYALRGRSTRRPSLKGGPSGDSGPTGRQQQLNLQRLTLVEMSVALARGAGTAATATAARVPHDGWTPPNEGSGGAAAATNAARTSMLSLHPFADCSPACREYLLSSALLRLPRVPVPVTDAAAALMEELAAGQQQAAERGTGKARGVGPLATVPSPSPPSAHLDASVSQPHLYWGPSGGGSGGRLQSESGGSTSAAAMVAATLAEFSPRHPPGVMVVAGEAGPPTALVPTLPPLPSHAARAPTAGLRKTAPAAATAHSGGKSATDARLAATHGGLARMALPAYSPFMVHYAAATLNLTLLNNSGKNANSPDAKGGTGAGLSHHAKTTTATTTAASATATTQGKEGTTVLLPELRASRGLGRGTRIDTRLTVFPKECGVPRPVLFAPLRREALARQERLMDGVRRLDEADRLSRVIYEAAHLRAATTITHMSSEGATRKFRSAARQRLELHKTLYDPEAGGTRPAK